MRSLKRQNDIQSKTRRRVKEVKYAEKEEELEEKKKRRRRNILVRQWNFLVLNIWYLLVRELGLTSS